MTEKTPKIMPVSLKKIIWKNKFFLYHIVKTNCDTCHECSVIGESLLASIFINIPEFSIYLHLSHFSLKNSYFHSIRISTSHSRLYKRLKYFIQIFSPLRQRKTRFSMHVVSNLHMSCVQYDLFCIEKENIFILMFYGQISSLISHTSNLFLWVSKKKEEKL